MNNGQDPLHGVTLEHIVTTLEARYGWALLGERINIRCFTDNPSIKSSLKFLRKTPWARAKVEAFYVKSVGQVQPKSAVIKSVKPAPVSQPTTATSEHPTTGEPTTTSAPSTAKPRIIPDKWKSF